MLSLPVLQCPNLKVVPLLPKCYNHPILITGTPGVDKSCYLIYLLHELK